MRMSLQNRPTDYFIRELLIAYRHSKPITNDTQFRLDYLRQYLSARGLDFLLNYYLDPKLKLTRSDADKLKAQLTKLLHTKGSHIELPPLRPALLQQLREVSTEELIFYHGNQFLTGAPFFLGGITHTIFFQWGNLFAVAKYAVLEDEVPLEGNLLIHCENRWERDLLQCIHDYQRKYWIQHQMHPVPIPTDVPEDLLEETLTKMANPAPRPILNLSFKPAPAPIPELQHVDEIPTNFNLPTPRLTLNKNDKREE